MARPNKRKPSPAKKGSSSSNCTDDDSSSAKDAKNPRVQSVIRLDPPSKPATDPNDYRLIQLPNGIIALLISSQAARKPPAWNQRTYNQFHDQTRIPLVGSRFAPKRNLLIAPERILGPTSEILLDSFLVDYCIPGRKLPEIESFLDPAKARRAKVRDTGFSNRSTAIAMVINVGSVNDPPNHKGLAHFCEHMMFLGSQKYESEDTSTKFGFDNGYMNAYTQDMTTTYYFSVPEDCLEKGLDIFSNMMAFPLFKAECISREVNVVDNEWNLCRTLDSVAYFSILSSIATQGHPLNGFLCGNLQTLLHPQDCNGMQDLQTALQAYHKTFYVGSAMTFAVQSSASLDRMEKLVVDSLTKISEGDRNIRHLMKVEEVLKFPFDNPSFNKLYVIKARETHRYLVLTWALPPEAWQNWENKPMNLLEVLMNDEWTGGLPYHLRKQGLIISYSAGCPPDELHRNDYTTIFQLEFVLTSKGLRDWEEIIKAVFGYVKRIQVTPLKQKIALWDELRNSSAKSFDYSSPGDDGTLTIESARLLQSIPGKHIFTAGCINGFSYDDTVFMKYLNLLTPSRMNAMLIIPSHEPIFKEITFNMIEPYTSTEYKVTGFNGRFMKTLKEMKPLPSVSIIPPNPLMSACSQVADLGFIDYQRIALGTQKVTAIHFGHMLPAKVFKARCVTEFGCSVMKNNARNLAYLSIWGECLQNLLLSDVSGIQRSGVDVIIYAWNGLICLELRGFSEMFTSTLENILIKIFNQVGFITEDTFQLVHENMINEFISGMGDKFSVLGCIIQELVIPNGPSSLEDHLRTHQRCSYKGFLAFLELFKSSCYGFLGLFENVSVKDGQRIAEIINKLNYSPVSKGWVPPERRRIGISLPFHDRCIRARSTVIGDRNTLVLNVYQLAHKGNYKVEEISIFLAVCMQARAFQILRSEKQLGYIVNCGKYRTDLLNSITLLITVVAPSDKHCACKVDQEIDGFLASFFHRYLKVMTNDEFQHLRKKIQLDGSIQLEDIVSWYEQNLLAAVKVDEKTGQGKWQDKTGKCGKLSIQVLGSDEEHCQTVERCLASGWAEKPVCGTQKILFVKDAPDTKVPYFIDNIKKFRNSITTTT